MPCDLVRWVQIDIVVCAGEVEACTGEVDRVMPTGMAIGPVSVRLIRIHLVGETLLTDIARSEQRVGTGFDASRSSNATEHIRCIECSTQDESSPDSDSNMNQWNQKETTHGFIIILLSCTDFAIRSDPLRTTHRKRNLSTDQLFLKCYNASVP
jgi:hypothetical protein